MIQKYQIRIAFVIVTSVFLSSVFLSCEKEEIPEPTLRRMKEKYDLKTVSNEQVPIIASFDNTREADIFLKNLSLLNFKQNNLTPMLKSGNAEESNNDETEFIATNHQESKTLICTAEEVGGNLPGMDFSIKVDYSDSSNPQIVSAEISGMTYGFSYDLDNQNVELDGNTYSFGASGSMDWGIQVGGTTYGASEDINISGYYNVSTNTCEMSNDEQFGW